MTRRPAVATRAIEVHRLRSRSARTRGPRRRAPSPARRARPAWRAAARARCAPSSRSRASPPGGARCSRRAARPPSAAASGWRRTTPSTVCQNASSSRPCRRRPARVAVHARNSRPSPPAAFTCTLRTTSRKRASPALDSSSWHWLRVNGTGISPDLTAWYRLPPAATWTATRARIGASSSAVNALQTNGGTRYRPRTCSASPRKSQSVLFPDGRHVAGGRTHAASATSRSATSVSASRSRGERSATTASSSRSGWLSGAPASRRSTAWARRLRPARQRGVHRGGTRRFVALARVAHALPRAPCLGSQTTGFQGSRKLPPTHRLLPRDGLAASGRALRSALRADGSLRVVREHRND